jgi:hypothetical protein
MVDSLITTALLRFLNGFKLNDTLRRRGDPGGLWFLGLRSIIRGSSDEDELLDRYMRRSDIHPAQTAGDLTTRMGGMLTG